jgi:flagellar motor switch protein FliN
VAETIEYEQFEGAPANGAAAAGADLSRLNAIPMELSVEIGRTHMTVGRTLELRVGSVVELERQAGDPVDLLVNGSPIARGEVVVVDEQYGLRITEILDGGQQQAAIPGVAGGDTELPVPEGEQGAGADGVEG